MKSEYEEKMYEFYTQTENFETMLHVTEQAKWVTEQLVRDFWKDVHHVLQETLQKRDDNLRVEFSNNGDWKVRWIKLWVYRKEWCLTGQEPLVSITAEALQPNDYPYIGIHINRDSSLINGDTIKAQIKILEELKSYKSDSNNYWAVWKYMGIKHYGQDLTLLLPENRKTSIGNVVSEFNILLDLMDTNMLEIITEHKIQ